MQALKLYKLDNQRYPTTEQGLKALVENRARPGANGWKTGGYVEKLPKDPWGNPYRSTGAGREGRSRPVLAGRRRPAGRVGDDADIGSCGTRSRLAARSARPRDARFTLVEIMVVLVIIGIAGLVSLNAIPSPHQILQG